MIESLRRRITEIEEHSGISLMVETATLEALLDAIEADRDVQRFGEDDSAMSQLTSMQWGDEFVRLRSRHEAALAALERSDEG